MTAEGMSAGVKALSKTAPLADHKSKPSAGAGAGAGGAEDEYEDDFDPVCNMNHTATITAQAEQIKRAEERIRELETKLKAAGITGTTAITAGTVTGSGAAATPPATPGPPGSAPPATPIGGRRRGQTPGAGTAASGAVGVVNLSEYRLKEIGLSSLTMGEQIAGGGFCTLHRGQWLGLTVAVKKIFDPIITPALKAEFANECGMLAALRHPNIVQILGACSVPPTLAIVTEFCARKHTTPQHRTGTLHSAATRTHARPLTSLRVC
jgi:hypothetical protein